MRKRIGITYTRTNFENYLNWFSSDSTEWDIVQLNFEQNNREEIPTCDGFVLTGGVDTHPSLYGRSANYENQPELFQIERDYFEAAVYAYARQHRLPVLAICRGMQLVNILEGGQLIQDLGPANNIHKKDQVDRTHPVNLLQGSLLHKTCGLEVGVVNSAHHQCIDPKALAPTLRITATAADGTIEGIEYQNQHDKGFFLGVQWHPERMASKETNPLSINIKKQFLESVMNTATAKLSVVNPHTEEVIGQLTMDDSISLDHKFQLLKNGQPQWATTPLKDRIAAVNRYASLLKEQIELLSATLTREMGKPLQQSRNEVNGSIARIQWLSDHATRYLSEEIMQEDASLTELIRYEPLGVVCNISAWNYPYLVGTNVFIPALLAGNAVLYKPSEYSTLTGLHIDKLLKQAGIPENVFQVAIGGASVGEALTDLPFNGFFFTGSYATGRKIYEKVAKAMVPCQCELGGKDPIYIAEDIADIHAVAAATADGAFYNNGQSCCAVERIYVQEKIYDQYVEAFVKEVRSWKMGDPFEEGVYIGPVSRKSQLDFLEKQVTDALNKGGTLVTGGKRRQGKGYFFEPTVIVNVNHQMLLLQEESFGPIIGIMKVRNDEEALTLMQDTAYGLTAGVYSASRERAERILNRIDAGTGYWNCCDRVSAALPWSGRKHSGIGSTLSHAGLRAFTQPKAYHLRK
ncbi:MAG: hypothetical protein RL732_975 [Bacteroidota bacterium]